MTLRCYVRVGKKNKVKFGFFIDVYNVIKKMLSKFKFYI